MFEIVRHKGIAINARRIKDGALMSINDPEFTEWNAKAQLDVTDKQPDPPTAKETESARKVAVALQIVKAVPEAWETGTAQQQIQWAFKQLFKRVAQEID